MAQQEMKNCDKDVGGCGKQSHVTKVLTKAPTMVALQLSWEVSVTREEIEQVMKIISTSLSLEDAFGAAHVPKKMPPVHKLTSFIGYYGQHYYAFILKKDTGVWLMLDDASISSVGDWAAVCQKLKAGRIQASVLFYEAASH